MWRRIAVGGSGILSVVAALGAGCGSDGNYQVQVSGEGANYRRAFAISGDTNGDIELPVLTISGFVTDAGSNEPLEGATLQAETGRERTGVPARYAATDSRGFYSF